MARRPDERRRGRLGELPEPLGRERWPRRAFDPNAGLYLDWYNRYQAINFGIHIGTANQTVLQENGLRTYLLIQNNHAANTLFVAFNSEASAFSSVHVLAGGFYELIGGAPAGAFCPKSSLNLLATGAATNVVIVEGTLQPLSESLRGR